MHDKENVIGYIYGKVGSTEFNFTVNQKNIRKFDYIYAPHKEGNMLAQVMNIEQHTDFKFDDAARLRVDDELPNFSSSLSAEAVYNRKPVTKSPGSAGFLNDRNCPFKTCFHDGG